MSFLRPTLKLAAGTTIARSCISPYRSARKVETQMKEEERVDQDEVWSAIRYLDPDEKDKDRTGSVGTVVRRKGSSSGRPIAFR
jgi:hypothetical protein